MKSVPVACERSVIRDSLHGPDWAPARLAAGPVGPIHLAGSAAEPGEWGARHATLPDASPPYHTDGKESLPEPEHSSGALAISCPDWIEVGCHVDDVTFFFFFFLAQLDRQIQTERAIEQGIINSPMESPHLHYPETRFQVSRHSGGCSAGPDKGLLPCLPGR